MVRKLPTELHVVCDILSDDLYTIMIFLQQEINITLHVEMVPMKATLLCVLLCLFWSLVEVQSQIVPYISFKGKNLPNHSYVNLGQVGEDKTGSDNDTVQCHTDLSTCCRKQPNGIPGRGDWFAPGSDTRMPFGMEDQPHDMYEDREAQVVHIRRRYNARNELSGIYRCVIPTNTVNDDNGSVGETVYVGLYKGSGGIITNTLSIPLHNT